MLPPSPSPLLPCLTETWFYCNSYAHTTYTENANSNSNHNINKFSTILMASRHSRPYLCPGICVCMRQPLGTISQTKSIV